jgi:8-amino-7-oxononanoate synthase
MHYTPPSIPRLLDKRVQSHSLRTLKDNTKLTDFCSNDYLGLARSAALADRVLQQMSEYQDKNRLNGATGSRLISGNADWIEEIEYKMAQYFESETGLIFSSGYMANMGVWSSIPQRGDTVLYDELSHACIKDGIRLSLANRFPFKHNDLPDLQKKIQQSTGNIYIAIESIYSMDGDEAPIEEIVTLAKQYGAYIIIDEAHSTGIRALKGQGSVVEKALQSDIFIRVHTFGKAMGTHGAFVACSQIVKDYLINFSRPFIYTTAPAPHQLLSMYNGILYLESHTDLITNLNSKIDFFRKEIAKTDLHFIQSRSPIQAIMISGVEAVKKKAIYCQENGFDVRPILSPTVREGQERIRICLHTYNTDVEIKNLVQTLSK